ncbi:MAG: PQQ-binding-like beta-propeller repeat protein [Phycisphaerales bacterium]|nr:PQQ-binding-like beta-propeller repeat protein [Phycisphaerales bacterium]
MTPTDPIPNPRRRSRRATAKALLVASIAFMATQAPAQAHQLQPIANQNPVYIADSPIATDALKRVDELLAQDNLDEAVRLCDEIIRVHGHRLIIADEQDPDRVHIPVRRLVNMRIRSNPKLLEAYRRQISPSARVLLSDENDWTIATRDAWLTEPGLIASIRRAQSLVESGRFHAGLAMLEQCRTHPDAASHQREIDHLASLAGEFIGKVPDGFEPEARARSFVWDSSPQPPVSLEGIVPGVLAKTELTPISQLDLLDDATPSRLSGASWKPTAWAAPLIEGQLLFTNDGFTISCLDRFTLRPVWRVQTLESDTETPNTPDARARLGRLLEDSTTISSDGRSALYVSAGVPRGRNDVGSATLLKLDRRTGSEQWRIDLSTLDPSLEGAEIRGPVVIDNGTVLVMARTSNRRQRLISLTLVAIDAATGRLSWLQPLASAGSLPFQQMGQLAHTPIVRDGIYYTTDMIGLAAAVRIATGEVLWARPLPAPDLYARTTRPAFAGNTPVINSYGLFALSSDGTRIIHIDPISGRTLGSRHAEQLGDAYYLLGVRDDLFLCVNTDRIIFYHADRFDTTNPRRTPELGDETDMELGIRGRVIVMGDRVLAPVEQGVRVINPDKPDESTFVALDATGNIAALDGQIIVVDQLDAMSFLAWDTASRLLSARVSEDPAAAITIAELAFRTDRLDEIVPSVEKAMQVVRAQPLDRRDAMRDALFQVVLDMVRDKQTDGTQAASFFDRIGEDRVIRLLRTLGELAHTHEQAVAHRMQTGAIHERYGRSTEAISAYQNVLDEPSLRGAMWEGSGIAVRAGLEASRRIGDIIKRDGFSAYQSADTRALAELGYLGDAATPDQYQSLAQRFPWSHSAPRMLLLASRGYQSSGDTASSIDAARSGVESFDRLTAMGMRLDNAILESLAERLISGLVSSNRTRDAYNAARALLDRHASLTLRRDGRSITIEQLEQAVGQGDTLPILGNAFINDPEPLLVTGSPIRPAHRLDPGGLLVYAPQLARLRYLRAGRNVFETFWERTAPGDQPPMVIWQGPARVLVFWPESAAGDTGTLEAIETSTGQLIWSVSALRTELEQGSARIADDAARVDTLIAVPALGSVPTRQLIVLCDGQSVVVTDRVGRAMGIDLFSGQHLWQRDLPPTRVHDIDLQHGVLGVCGVVIVDRAQDQRNGSVTPLLASIDARSGEPGQVIERFGFNPRWVRVGNRNRLFVASAQRITALDVEHGIIDWVVNDENISDSQNAWVGDTRLFVLSDRSTLWALDTSDGSRPSRPLDTRGRINQRGWVRLIPEIGRTTLLTEEGFMCFDAAGELSGLDTRLSDEPLIDIAWGQRHAVQLGEPTIQGESLVCEVSLINHIDARLLDTTSLRIPAALGRTPINAVPVNGGVLVGFGEVSIFLRTTE